MTRNDVVGQVDMSDSLRKMESVILHNQKMCQMRLCNV